MYGHTNQRAHQYAHLARLTQDIADAVYAAKQYALTVGLPFELSAETFQQEVDASWQSSAMDC